MFRARGHASGMVSASWFSARSYLLSRVSRGIALVESVFFFDDQAGVGIAP